MKKNVNSKNSLRELKESKKQPQKIIDFNVSAEGPLLLPT